MVRTADRPGGGGGGQRPPVLPGSFNLPDGCSLWTELVGLVRGPFGIDIVPLGEGPASGLFVTTGIQKTPSVSAAKP